MSTNAVVRARIGARTKQEPKSFLEAIGLTVSDAFRLMMMRVVVERRLPFERLIPNETTIQAMPEARHGEGAGFNSVEELMADLNAGDLSPG
jgi:DNA-damage-inducible protein J